VGGQTPLQTVPGVAEVASVGGQVRQFHVVLDPVRMQALGLDASAVAAILSRAGVDAGGESVELSETEWMVRGRGQVRTLQDLKDLPVALAPNGPSGGSAMGAMGGVAPAATFGAVSVRLDEVAEISEGPAMRRGLTDLDGQGEVVAGRGRDALWRERADHHRGRARQTPGIGALAAGRDEGGAPLRSFGTDRAGRAPPGLETAGGNARSVALVCALFLFHVRSALVAVFTLPVALLVAFLVMRLQGIGADIMSLGGLAIAIGAMVDASIILVENAHKHLEHEQSLPESERRDRWSVVVESSREVGPSLFWSLLLITVSFLPVFALQAQEGRLFHPLAWTKTWAMAAAAGLSVTLVPVLAGLFLGGRIPSEDSNPFNRLLVRIYHPVVKTVLGHPRTTLALALVVLASALWPLKRLGTEFMPPLFEGDLLYMPTVLPGISVTKAGELLQQTDRMIRSVPEVEQVFGKAGRAETATDPAGLDMFETVIRLKPPAQWRPGMTVEKLVQELDHAVHVPGLTNAWTLPIKSRIDMLSTGIRTPIGIKLSGADPDTLQALAGRVEGFLKSAPDVSSAFAERAAGGWYLDVRIDRAKAALRGVTPEDVNDVLRMGLSGMPVATAIDGLERVAITVRLERERRQGREDLQDLRVRGAEGPVRLGDIASVDWTTGPMVVRSEAGRPDVFVFVDTRRGDLGGLVRDLAPRLAAAVPLPPGYGLVWSGQWEGIERVRQRMLAVVPFTLLLIVLILFLNTRSLARTTIVLLAVPFSLVGAFWFLHLAGYQISVAVWVGLIALAGLDAETGVVMLMYLDQAWDKRKAAGQRTLQGLLAAIDEGAVRRVRPKAMTAAVILAGLVPILWSDGTGSDVMKRIAAPMVGGILTSVAMELLVYPVLFLLWQRRLVERPPKPAQA
jgi:Cu(I)/Ag(I) efflux system membrane protein CusA/SilA